MNEIDLLVIFPCNQSVLNDILLVDDYNSMQAYFINKELARIKDKNIVCVGIDNLWKPKGVKNRITYSQISDALAEHDVNLSNCKNIMFTKIGAYRQFQKGTLANILDTILGSTYKFEDCNVRLFENERVCTIGHFTSGLNTTNYYDAGLSIATDVFVPNQNYSDKVFKVHVDHNYAGVDNSFDAIKNFLSYLADQIQKDGYWEELEIYYHDRLCDIEDLGNFDFNNLDIESLAKIYGQCHLSFISHRESLGQYPLEMLSAGAGVVLMRENFLNGTIRNKLKDVLITDLSNISLDVDHLKNQSIKNREKILSFSYKNFVNTILNLIL